MRHPSPHHPVPSTPFAALGVDVFRAILSHVAAESLDTVISTEAYRRLLPFAVTCKHHYMELTNTIKGLSLLPLHHTTSKKQPIRRVPPFPLALLPSPSIRPLSTSLSLRLPPALAHLPNLRTLHLFRNSEISDIALHAIVNAVPQLRELRLRACTSLTSSGIKCLVNCKSLYLLDLSYCHNLSDECAPILAKIPTLRQLFVANWPVSDHFIKIVCTNSNLTHLGLTSCVQLTAAACTSIAEQGRIVYVQLRSHHLLCDDAIDNLSKCSTLEHIDLTLSRSLSNGCLSSLCKTRLPNLRTLSLSNVNQLTDDGIKELVNKHGGLREIDVSFCHMLTDVSAMALSTLEYVECINLAGCVNMTDAGVEQLARMSWLRSLVLARCVAITDAAVHMLVASPAAPFDCVDLRKCVSVSEAALDELERVSCHRLLRSET